MSSAPAPAPCESDGGPARKRQHLEGDGEDVSTSSRGGSGSDSDGPKTEQDESQTLHHSSSDAASSKLIGLRLEAIFHPKFDNEKRTTADIRSRMLDCVEASKGYLEVSLKHSGSLLLWSGGVRYYSKNFTDNRFAHVGEILLRQHFARVWFDSTRKDTTDTALCIVNEANYSECSDEVESRRLTLSFEVVTSVLGQHGDIPRRDFLILTAIADRSNGGRFFDTLELVEFAQKYRLPHNDFWLFQTIESCHTLFSFYDSSRETALADGSIATLSASCDGGHIQSIYPHVAFQGNILEGLVIRYVSYEGSTDGSMENNAGKTSMLHQKTQELAGIADEILTLVPPDRESSFAIPPLLSTSSDVLSTDIRTLSASESFDTALRETLRGDNDGTQRRRVSFIREKDITTAAGDLVQMVHDMSSSEANLDSESLTIASLIQRLDELNIPVNYKLFQNNYASNSNCGKPQTLCIIHIMRDYAFQKFTRQMKDGDMPLYRGFVVRLMLEGEGEDKDEDGTFNVRSAVKSTPTTKMKVDEDALMLKMKFLPYMVRTFGIRNGLSILEKSGSEAYDRYAMNLLNTWGVSQEAMERWQHFFHCWGVHAGKFLFKQNRNISDGNEGIDLPRLGTDTYLQHLSHFSNLYYSGMLEGASNATEPGVLRGLVVVVSLTRHDSSYAAGKVSTCLSSRRADDVNSITENDMMSSMMQGTGGLVCSAVVEDGTKAVRVLNRKYGKYIYVILVGCSDDAVEKSLEPGSELKRRIGMLKGWRNVQCNTVVDWLDLSKLDENAKSFADTLQDLSLSASDQDTRPGLLVFFPGIPGCGKSSLCHDVDTNILHSTASGGSKPRSVHICVGDKVEGKYWPLVRRERMSVPSSISFSDKNAPPTVWSTIADIAAASRAAVLPVLPDASALATTSIELESGKQINFPFSLLYLAVSMQRVLSRPDASHVGKLDASCKEACMVVVKFYCLYRNLSAEQFIEQCRREMDTAGAYLSPDLVQVPFFGEEAPLALPQDLEEVLENAVRLQIDTESSILDGANKQVEAMESRLRGALSEHGKNILKYTATEEESRSSFLSQVSKHVLSLDELKLGTKQPRAAKRSTGPSFIKIVSIDVDTDLLHKTLGEMAHRDVHLSLYLQKIGILEVGGDKKTRGTLVKRCHVTMAHYSQQSQMDIRSRFGTIVGKEVTINVTSYLYGENSAALSVALPSTTMGELPIPLPASENQYPHITIWFGEGAKAADSNILPDLVSTGEAKMFQPPSDITVQGKLSYWMIDRPE